MGAICLILSAAALAGCVWLIASHDRGKGGAARVIGACAAGVVIEYMTRSQEIKDIEHPGKILVIT